MIQSVQLSCGVEPLLKLIRGAKPRHSGARAHAAIGLSVAALVAAAPPGACANALDAPAEHESTPDRIRSPLSVAPVVEVESPGQADCRISISRRESLPLGAYVRIRGLPTEVELSAGRPWWEKIAGQADEQRAWVVPVKATEDLKIRMPRGVSGNSELLITLIDGNGRMLAEDSSELRIMPQVALAPAEQVALAPVGQFALAPVEKMVSLPIEPPVAPPAEKVVVPSAPEKVAVASPGKAAGQPQRSPDEITTSALSPSAPSLSPRDRPAPSSADLAQADRLVGKGESYLARGDIAIARQYFERAAELGLPIAALRMAETQDPRELARRGVHGVKANLDEARRWYQRALELDVPEAGSKLRRLGSQ
jgi:hypothetical protein